MVVVVARVIGHALPEVLFPGEKLVQNLNF
jgi:hypothetical protein